MFCVATDVQVSMLLGIQKRIIQSDRMILSYFCVFFISLKPFFRLYHAVEELRRCLLHVLFACLYSEGSMELKWALKTCEG